MGSKTISLDDEAYDLLKAAKLPDESFSDVVKRALSHARPKLADFAGLLSDAEGKRLERFIKTAKNGALAADERRRKKLWG